MAKRIILIMVVLGIVSLAVLQWRLDQGPVTPENRIFVSGNIEAVEVDLSFRIMGEIYSLPIDEGDELDKGQVVATLDTDTLRALKGAAEAEINAAKAVLDELEEGTREEDIAMARARLKAAEHRMENAKEEYLRHLPLFKRGVISESTFDMRETSLEVAQEDYNNAKEALNEAIEGPREEQIRQAKARLERAKWEFRKIELDIEHSTVKSPIPGVVLVKSNELGEVVLPGATVATIGRLDEVWLKGYIAENRLGMVKLGQKVNVISDTYPDKKYEGKVTFISSRAEFTPKNVQTKEERIKQVYRIKVTIPNKKRELKIGMPAEGYIVIDDKSPEQLREKERSWFQGWVLWLKRRLGQ
jgi:HlyD family secretion protein